MGLVMDKNKGNYKVTDLILEHNHTLHLPQTSHLMASLRKISELQGFELTRLTMQELGQKLHMSWLVSKLEAQLILVTLFETTRTIYGASDNGRWHMVKQEACLCIFRKKIAENPSIC